MEAADMNISPEAFHSGLQDLDSITGGFRRGETYWILGNIPMAEQLIWFGLDIAAAIAFSSSTDIGVFCFDNDPNLLKDEIRLLRSTVRDPKAHDGRIEFYNLRGIGAESGMSTIRSEIERNKFALVVVESIRLTKKGSGDIDQDLVNNIESLATETNCCFLVIPWGANQAYLYLDDPKLNEEAGREFKVIQKMPASVGQSIYLDANWFSAPFYRVEKLKYGLRSVDTISVGGCRAAIKSGSKLHEVPLQIVSLFVGGEQESEKDREVTKFYCIPKYGGRAVGDVTAL
jgi:hypothetical protein